jgi:hypothetical protein
LPCARSCSSRWPCWWRPRSPCPQARAPRSAALTAQAQPSGQLQSANREYVVAYADGASTATARAAAKAAGGTILKENTRVGVATVRSANPAFVRAAADQRALVGAARNRPIGRIPSGASAAKDEVERLTAAERAIDPWLYNCLDNPADSPEARAEQRTVRVATQRAVNFARGHGVTPIAAMGNQHTDLGNPTSDNTSPDFPPGAAYPRTVDNSCITVPTETRGVISISALGPSFKKADYSNYGIEQTDFSAPGGFFRDYYSSDQYMQPENMNLSPMPRALAEEALQDPANARSSCATARARSAATTGTCRAPRWPPRTRPGWPR